MWHGRIGHTLTFDVTSIHWTRWAERRIVESTRTLQHELEVGTKDFSWKMTKRKRDLMLAGQTPVNVKRARRRKNRNTHMVRNQMRDS